jgi:hypothetical protein
VSGRVLGRDLPVKSAETAILTLIPYKFSAPLAIIDAQEVCSAFAIVFNSISNKKSQAARLCKFN